MKKRNYFALQFILSIILIAMGVLLEWRGRDIVHGVPYLLFIIPGSIILLGYFIELFHFPSHFIYIGVYILLVLIADVATIIAFHISLNPTVIGLMAGLLILSVGVTAIFHFIYDNLKHPNRLIRL